MKTTSYSNSGTPVSGIRPFVLPLALAALSLGFAAGLPAADQAPNASTAVVDSAPIRVRTVHPRRGADLTMTVEQPANVSPYYRAALYAEASGKVTFLEKDLGHAVIKGEKIAVITPSGGLKGPANVLEAPFDGVIASRNADPGTFVASAAVVPGATPLVTLERNDIVTITAQMPDRVANLIGRDTEAEIYLDDLPGGGPLRARISRIAPSIYTTMPPLTPSTWPVTKPALSDAR